ncbi:polysaccharide deacetylase family protein [Bacillus niameyensis]|uniref:hypothetical protein n=1 Tax=Bacillus niameyensis TaxID=1522308 RepID=UPI000783316E|nr:hypothetical protein [Bacillus niameyensis]
MKLARIGVFFDKQASFSLWADQKNIFERYIIEVLEHARIPYDLVDSLSAIQQFNILIVAVAKDDDATRKTLLHYVSLGGTIINYGGLDFLAEDLNCKSLPKIKKGYADLHLEFHQESSLRFLHAAPWECLETNTLIEKGNIREENLAALQQFSVGKGLIDRWAIHIPESIVAFQQGTAPVTEDGIPAPDGTANLDEGILKADDGFELDWEKDREHTETGIPYFSQPYADLWREVILEHLLQRVLDQNLTLPFVEPWPSGIDQIAMISHDSDLNVEESAEAALKVLEEIGVCSTWCMIAPGYSSEMYEKVKQAGHELAFHYNALETEGGSWSEEEFNAQLAWLKKAISENDVISNKNHYTRFEGWGELFRWCERNGIEVDQTRGPSKKGNVGFPFGTCKPYFPVAWADEHNRFYNVLEIGFLTQDLNHETLADTSVIQPFLEKVKRVNGVAHFLFHQIHIYNKPAVRKAIIEVAETAKAEGFTFWTSKQINEWERARRTVQLTMEGEKVKVSSDREMDDLVVWIPVKEGSESDCVYKFGIPGIRQIVKAESIKI